MCDKFINLDNDNLFKFIKENMHWIYAKQKLLFDSINSQYSNKNWISKKQRNALTGSSQISLRSFVGSRLFKAFLG